MKTTHNLEGKTALITGGTRGIGAAIARGFVAAGAKVYIHGRDREIGEISARQIGARFLKADLLDPEASAQIDSALPEPVLDILVNNAGAEVIMPFENWRMDVFDRIWQVNVRSLVDLTRKMLPRLKSSPASSIINVTSIHGRMPAPHNIAYSMAKAAVEMFTAGLAVELGPLGIRVNNLAPGATRTDMNSAMLDRLGPHTFDQWVPLGRVGSTDEMIGPALFLASEASSYLTGSTLTVDGGYVHNLLRYRAESEV